MSQLTHYLASFCASVSDAKDVDVGDMARLQEETSGDPLGLLMI